MALVVKDWQDAPSTSTPLSAAAMEDLETRLAAYTDRFAVGYQTSLPGSPADGDVIAYAADATNGVIWNLRYRSGASGSYKWEFIGGAPLWGNDATSGTRTTGYGDLTSSSVGPSITLPLAGDYIVTTGVESLSDTANANCYASFAIGGSAAVDANALYQANAGTGTRIQINLAASYRLTSVSASTALVMKYKADTGTGTFRNRTIQAIPVRVG